MNEIQKMQARYYKKPVMSLEEQLNEFNHIPVKYSIPIQLESDKQSEPPSEKKQPPVDVNTVKFVLERLADAFNMERRQEPLFIDQDDIPDDDVFYEDNENLDIDNQIIEVESPRHLAKPISRSQVSSQLPQSAGGASNIVENSFVTLGQPEVIGRLERGRVSCQNSFDLRNNRISDLTTLEFQRARIDNSNEKIEFKDLNLQNVVVTESCLSHRNAQSHITTQTKLNNPATDVKSTSTKLDLVSQSANQRSRLQSRLNQQTMQSKAAQPKHLQQHQIMIQSHYQQSSQTPLTSTSMSMAENRVRSDSRKKAQVLITDRDRERGVSQDSAGTHVRLATTTSQRRINTNYVRQSIDPKQNSTRRVKGDSNASAKRLHHNLKQVALAKEANYNNNNSAFKNSKQMVNSGNNSQASFVVHRPQRVYTATLKKQQSYNNSNYHIKQSNQNTGVLTTVTPSGAPSSQSFNNPSYNYNHQKRKSQFGVSGNGHRSNYSGSSFFRDFSGDGGTQFNRNGLQTSGSLQYLNKEQAQNLQQSNKKDGTTFASKRQPTGKNKKKQNQKKYVMRVASGNSFNANRAKEQIVPYASGELQTQDQVTFQGPILTTSVTHQNTSKQRQNQRSKHNYTHTQFFTQSEYQMRQDGQRKYQNKGKQQNKQKQQIQRAHKNKTSQGTNRQKSSRMQHNAQSSSQVDQEQDVYSGAYKLKSKDNLGEIEQVHMMMQQCQTPVEVQNNYNPKNLHNLQDNEDNIFLIKNNQRKIYSSYLRKQTNPNMHFERQNTIDGAGGGTVESTDASAKKPDARKPAHKMTKVASNSELRMKEKVVISNKSSLEPPGSQTQYTQESHFLQKLNYQFKPNGISNSGMKKQQIQGGRNAKKSFLKPDLQQIYSQTQNSSQSGMTKTFTYSQPSYANQLSNNQDNSYKHANKNSSNILASEKSSVNLGTQFGTSVSAGTSSNNQTCTNAQYKKNKKQQLQKQQLLTQYPATPATYARKLQPPQKQRNQMKRASNAENVLNNEGFDKAKESLGNQIEEDVNTKISHQRQVKHLQQTYLGPNQARQNKKQTLSPNRLLPKID